MRIGTHTSPETIAPLEKRACFGASLRATPWTVGVGAVRALRALVLQLMLALIVLYQRCISPFVGASCRFSPTCSAYAATSLRKYGLVKGLFRAGWRVLRCHPFCRGGHDPP